MVALQRYELLDTVPEQTLDDLAALAAQICNAPIALISLVDEERVWFKSRAGDFVSEMARDVSFCGHAILQPDLFIVPDAATDERFADNPLVSGDPGIRFYAGAPLATPNGQALGTLCVIDHVPRQLTPSQRDALRMLSRQVMTQLELRRQTRELIESKASRELLMNVIDSTPSYVFATDRQNRYILVNASYTRWLGKPAAEILGRTQHELFDQELADALVATNETVMATGEPQQRDDMILNTMVSLVKFPLRDSHGAVIGLCGVVTDITDRKRAEDAQQASEERYRTLFEYAPDGIVIADRESYYIDANASMCRMLGYSRDEFIGLHASDIVTAAEIQHIGSALQTITTTSDYHRQWQFRRKDGSMFPAEVIATMMPDGNLMAMIRDVTDQNRAVDALRTAEERMRFALESADVGIWDMDYTTGVLQWSEIMEAQYAVEPGTFPGTFEAFVERVHPDDRASLLETMGNAMKTGADFSVQHRSVSPDGATRWLSGAGRIVLGEHGEPVRGVGISLDITDRHTLEEQYQQAQKMEAIGRLAGGVAHDFNNLLTAILGYCDLLLPEFQPDDPRRPDIMEIQLAGTRAAGLTRQLLAFSRKQIIEPTLLDLNSVVTDMRSMLERLIGEDVQVVLGLRPDLAFVMADRGQVEQIVMNLAVNARDAMPNGGTLRIETANVELDEHYAKTHLSVKAGPYVALAVTDTGTGMTPDVQARLFEPFFTTKEVGRGTGLGLATVHGIIMRSGGTVNVYSEIGKGTSFNVYFPRADATEMVIEAPPPVSRPHVGAETVLVVEDEEALRELARRMLVRQGYTALIAANADEARLLFEQNASIDVLLTDVVMPGASGPELSKQLLEQRPGLKVIYMSGYTEDVIVHHGVLDPGIAFLHKPFTSDTLGRKLREVLDR